MHLGQAEVGHLLACWTDKQQPIKLSLSASTHRPCLIIVQLGRQSNSTRRWSVSLNKCNLKSI